jgi:hypothetical protein
VSKFVLVPLFFRVPNLDYYSVSTALAAFRWLLFPSESIDEFALLCDPLTFLTVSYGPLRRPDYLFNIFF